jgi:hypothetical protein
MAVVRVGGRVRGTATMAGATSMGAGGSAGAVTGAASTGRAGHREPLR